jgi:hypothetical protein
MEVECGKHHNLQKSLILVNGLMENLMDSEFTLMVLEIDIKDNLIMDLNKDMELKDILMEIFMLVIL